MTAAGSRAGSRAGLLAGVVFCALPRATWMGTEARSYALTAAFAVLLTIVFVCAVRSPGRRWWIIYGLVVVLCCVMFVYLALVVAAHAMALASLLRSTGRGARAVIGRFTIATSAAVLVVSPFVAEVVSQSRQVGWLEAVGWGTVRGVFVDQWFLDSPWFAMLAWPLLVVGAVALVRRHRSDRGLSPAAIILPALVLPTVALVVYSVASPLYTPRYLTMCLPFVAIVIAAGVAYLPTRQIGVLVLAALLVLAIPPAIAERQANSKQSTHWAEVAELIGAQRLHDGHGRTTAIIYGWVHNHPLATSRVIAQSYPDAFVGTIDVTLKLRAAQTGRLWETRNPLVDSMARLDGADVTYLITSTSRDLRAATTTTLAAVGWHLEQAWVLGDVRVLRYER